MLRLVKIFFVGMLISFVGSLPLGSMNIAAMQISITQGYVPALAFGTGVFLVEMIYVRISLVAMDQIRKHEKVLKALEYVTLVIVVGLAVSSFIAAGKNSGNTRNILLSNGLPRFVLGAIMSALNPVQIPFWFGWSTVLFTKKILLPNNQHYHFYIAGIGLGTLLATSVFIFGGLLMMNALNANQNLFNYAIGGIFTVTALIQTWKMWFKKDAVQKIHDLKEAELHPERMNEKSAS
jgi:threonine/homoserine/homoserine lactone efflux protein